MAATATTARRVTFFILLALVAAQLVLIGAFVTAWAIEDTPATIGDCTGIDLSTTFDANRDGVIDCGSDIELGA
jgi:hypothetical protein